MEKVGADIPVNRIVDFRLLDEIKREK
jgi:hypothetical protein